MSERKNTRVRSPRERAAIRRYYAIKAAKEKQGRVEAPYPHFRYYKKSKHPALIVGEQKTEQDEEEYRYRKATHSAKEGRHNNDKIEPNPNPKDNRPMYIVRRERHDLKKNFEDKPLPWKPPKNTE